MTASGAEIRRLVVQLDANATKLQESMRKAAASANDNFRVIENRGKQAARKLDSSFAEATRGVSEKFRLMASSAAGALTAAFSLNQLKRYADSWTEARSKIAAAGEELSNVAARQSQLTDLAIRSRADLGATVDLYTSLKRATESLGAKQAQVLQVTETINKAFAISGASASTAAGAILQLGQAFASGALRGDELNSILEGAPPLARLIAKEMGVGVGELKKLGESGALTADKIFQALLNGSKSIQEEFAKTTPTVSQAVNILNTSLARYVGELDQATGASATLSGALVSMAEHANITGPALAAIAAGLSAAFVGGPIAGGIAAATVAIVGFGAQIRPISGDLASLADYAAVAFTSLKNLATDAASGLQERFIQAAQLISDALADMDYEKFLAAVKAVGNAVIGVFVATTQTIRTAWTSLGGAIAEAMIDAMNAVIAAAEAAANKVAAITSRVTFGAFNPAAVDLGRIENTYRGAGHAAARGFNNAFDALGKDYIGDIGKALDDIRKKANERAASRNTPGAALNDGSVSAPLKSSPATGSGKGKAAHENDYQREVRDLEQKVRALDMEREALGKEALEVERTKAAFDLLEAAKKANIAVTPELSAKVDSLATSYANAKVKLDEAKQRQDDFKAASQEAASTLSEGFKDALLNGERLSSILDKLVKKLAGMAIDKAFSSLISGATGTGGLFGSIGKVFGFAEGGLIQGPGGPRSDSILAAVSNGEFVVNADATKKYGALLEAINSGRIPKFASGGVVGSAPAISSPKFAASANMGGGAPININSTINLTAAGGSDEENTALAKKVSTQVEHQIRNLIISEIGRQQRPGNLLYR